MRISRTDIDLTYLKPANHLRCRCPQPSSALTATWDPRVKPNRVASFLVRREQVNLKQKELCFRGPALCTLEATIPECLKLVHVLYYEK